MEGRRGLREDLSCGGLRWRSLYPLFEAALAAGVIDCRRRSQSADCDGLFSLGLLLSGLVRSCYQGKPFAATKSIASTSWHADS